MALLTPTQIEESHAWLNDIFVWGNLLKKDQRSYNDPSHNYVYCKLMMYSSDYAGKNAAVGICNMIKIRKVDSKEFEKYAEYFSDLQSCRFEIPLHGSDKIIRRNEEMLMKYVVNFCIENNIMWNSNNTSTYELDEIINNNVFGKLLYENDCFTHEQPQKAKAAAKRSKQQKQTTTAATGTANNTGMPNNKYKYSGAHSGDIPNLIGQPGNKLTLSGPLFCIVADKVGAHTPCAYIKPIDYSASLDQIKKFSKAEAEKVSFGPDNYFTKCCIWFDDAAKADAALKMLQNTYSNFTNMKVAKQTKPDTNGYYKVSTDYGEVYIKAGKLNEGIEESLENSKTCDEHKQEKVQYTKKYDIKYEDLDAYEEAFYHEI